MLPSIFLNSFSVRGQEFYWSRCPACLFPSPIPVQYHRSCLLFVCWLFYVEDSGTARCDSIDRSK